MAELVRRGSLLSALALMCVAVPSSAAAVAAGAVGPGHAGGPGAGTSAGANAAGRIGGAQVASARTISHPSPQPGKWSGRTITFGSIFSLTGIGASFGPNQAAGADLAVDQLNSSGGINGAKVRLVEIDDTSVPANSVAAIRRLIGPDRVLAVLGPTFSNAAFEADPVANAAEMPVLAVSNTATGIVGHCAYPCQWIFRDSLPESEALTANVAVYAARAHPESAEVLAPSDDPYAASTAAVAAAALRTAGVTELPAPTFKTSSGLAPVVATALAAHPAALVVIASSGTVIATIIRDARGDGFKGGILGSNGLNSPSIQLAAGAAARGAQSAAGWFIGNPAPANKAFVTSYRHRYGVAPDQFAAQAFTGVMLLARAATKAPLRFMNLGDDRAGLHASLAATHLPTPLGPFSFTADHDVRQPIWVVVATGTGSYRLVREVKAGATPG